MVYCMWCGVEWCGVVRCCAGSCGVEWCETNGHAPTAPLPETSSSPEGLSYRYVPEKYVHVHETHLYPFRNHKDVHEAHVDVSDAHVLKALRSSLVVRHSCSSLVADRIGARATAVSLLDK